MPDFTRPFELHTDASHYGTGAILHQRDDEEHPKRRLKVVGFYSYAFSKAEVNYYTTENDALAVVMDLRYLQSYLEGVYFKLLTDN